MTDECESIIEEEVGVLEAIYIHELEVQRNDGNDVTEMVLQLHPSTGDNLDQQYVCMTLILGIPAQYPNEPPNIEIKNPRGIGEEEVQSTLEAMLSLCDERKGEAMLYELIELAKESLTEGNIPRCACMICLEHFLEGDNFQKTSCYHYFHDECLGRYVKHVLLEEPEIKVAHVKVEAKKILCPVCREEINYSEDSFPETPVEEKIIFYPSVEMKKMQADMAAMLEKQRQNGGLIDLEAEKNKFLVKADDVVYLNPSSSSLNTSPSISSDNLEDLGLDKGEENKRDPKSSRGGSGMMKNKGRGSRFEGRRYTEGEGRGNTRERSDRDRYSYGQRRERKDYGRDDYNNTHHRNRYRDKHDKNEGGTSTDRYSGEHDKHDGETLSGARKNNNDKFRDDGRSKSVRSTDFDEGDERIEKDKNKRHRDGDKYYGDRNYNNRSQHHRPSSSRSDKSDSKSFNAGDSVRSPRDPRDSSSRSNNNIDKQCKESESDNIKEPNLGDHHIPDLSDETERNPDSNNESTQKAACEIVKCNKNNAVGETRSTKIMIPNGFQGDASVSEDRRHYTRRPVYDKSDNKRDTEDRRNGRPNDENRNKSGRSSDKRRDDGRQFEDQRNFERHSERRNNSERHPDQRRKTDYSRNEDHRQREDRNYSDRQYSGRDRVHEGNRQHDQVKRERKREVNSRQFVSKSATMKVGNHDSKVRENDKAAFDTNCDHSDTTGANRDSVANTTKTDTVWETTLRKNEYLSEEINHSVEVLRDTHANPNKIKEPNHNHTHENRHDNERKGFNKGRGRGRGFTRRKDTDRTPGKQEHNTNLKQDDVVDKFRDLSVKIDGKDKLYDLPNDSSDVKTLPDTSIKSNSETSKLPGLGVKPPPGF